MSTTSFAGIDLIDATDTSQEDYGRWLIHGPQGTGKSTLASTIARLGPTLYIDMLGEKGVRSFRGAPYAKNISIARPPSIKALDELFWELNAGEHKFKAVVLDSLTSAQKMTMRYLMGHDETAVREIEKNTAPADQRTWGQALDVMTDIATFWYGLADGDRGTDPDKPGHPMHVVMTAQTKMVEDPISGVTSRIPDVQKGAQSLTLATPDYIVYTDLEQNLDAMGDDSQSPYNHIVRFGANVEYRTKARLPFDKRGLIPPIIGRERTPDLSQLSRTLGIGGVPAVKKAAAKRTTQKTEE